MYSVQPSLMNQKLKTSSMMYSCFTMILHAFYSILPSVYTSLNQIMYTIRPLNTKYYYFLTDIDNIYIGITRREMPMKLASWNVNGLRACVRKGFLDYFHTLDADFFSVQEIKLQEGQIDLLLEGYQMYWNYAERKGYSGTAIFTKHTPMSVSYGLEEDESQSEGRIINLEYENFFLVNIYSPNSQRDLARLHMRLEWEDRLFKHLTALDAQKPVIICGDLNVAHQMIDIRNAKANIGNSGFTEEERGKFNRLLEAGFVDTLRHFEPNTEGLYTWWSYMKTVRERNIGWRIDYFLVSERMIKSITKSTTEPSVMGSDHCPIVLELDESTLVEMQ